MRIPIPPSDQMRMELAEARAKAQQIRQRQVRASGRIMGTVEQLNQQLAEAYWIGPSETSVRQWCEEKAAAAWREWETSGKKLLAEREPWFNGAAVSFMLVWKDGVITNGSAKVELLPGKTVQVSSIQELIGGAAYGT